MLLMTFLNKGITKITLFVFLSIVFNISLIGQTHLNKNYIKQNIQFADSVIIVSHFLIDDYSGKEIPDWDKSDTIMNLEKWKYLHSRQTFLLDNGKFNRKIIKECVILNDTSKAKLISILLKQVHSRKVELMKCDEPTNAIVIYNKKIESYIDICFTCFKIHTSKNIHFDESNLDERKWKELATLFKSNGLTVQNEND